MVRFRAPVTQDLGPDVPTESLCGLWSLEASRVAGGSPKCQSARDAKGGSGEDFVKWWDINIYLLHTGLYYYRYLGCFSQVGPLFIFFVVSKIRAYMHIMHAYIERRHIYVHTCMHAYHTIPYHFISLHYSTVQYIHTYYLSNVYIYIYICISLCVHTVTYIVCISLSWIPGRQWLRLHRSARGLRGPPRRGRGARGARGHAKGAACREDRDVWALNM